MPEDLLKQLPDGPYQLDARQNLQLRSAETIAEQASRPFFTLLPRQRVLQVAGTEAATFLQGQLTCDMDEIDGYYASLGAHCNPKGRMVASFRIARSAEECYSLALPAGALPLLEASLNKYIVFSKAQVTTPGIICLALSGDEAAATADTLANGLPELAGGQFDFDGGTLLCIDPAAARYELWVDQQRLPDIWAMLASTLECAGSHAWDLQQVRAGIALVEEQTSDRFIPQMFNYDELKAISFSKGCYTGQEVVARAHYRGAVKRHLHRFSLASDATPEAGVAVSGGDDRELGSVVQASPVSPGHHEGLLVLKEGAEDKTLIINGQSIQLVD